MTDIKREAMGLWEWVAFLDRTEFFGKCKALIQFKTFNQRANALGKCKTAKIYLAQKFQSAYRKNKFPPQQR